MPETNYALLVMTRGTYTSLEDVHDAWAIWRNATVPEHRSLVPFAKLTYEVRELDRGYMEAIWRTSRRVASSEAGSPSTGGQR